VKLLLLLCALAFLAFAGPEKLDPMLRAFFLSPPDLQPLALSTLGAETLDRPIRVFVELADGVTDFPGLRTRVGNLATSSLTLPEIYSLSEKPDVLRIRAARPVEPLLDYSVPEVGAPALWYGSPSTTGQGVLVGFVDSGVDILHPAFRLDRDGDGFLEGSRILFYWDQTGGSGWFPDFWGDEPGEGRYGRVYSQRELEGYIRAGFSPAPDNLGHGTHVAGIAAGGKAAGFPGVAPGADLVVVKTNFYEDGVVDGIKFVFEAAKFLGKPAVVNLSLGGHSGPHDGKGLFERMVSALVEGPGRVIVAAAGNEGAKKIHVGGEIRSQTTWTIVPGGASLVARFWYELPARFSITVTSPLGETLTVFPGQARGLTTASGILWLDNTGTSLGATQEVFLTLTGAASGTAWRITFEPVLPGRVDGWIESPSMGYFLEGDGQMTIAEPGNAERVITVGAYVTKISWNSQAGFFRAEGYELYALAPFSSRGPTRDGRLKPEIAAPGAWIASARSRDAQVSPWYALPDGLNMMLAGTSMSAPHVAGACALLLSLRSGLSWSEILAALRAGARADSFVGSAPNPSWGFGKLDLPRTWAALQPPSSVQKPGLFLLANPVSFSAHFRYQIPENAHWAELRIYDLLGRLVWREMLSLGSETVRWDLLSLSGFRVSSGLYLALVVTDQGVSDPVRVVVNR